ncbi:MAG: amidohydrolase family protein [Halobacteria archaeon]|nr:amidohydrolase family protein [Halobacteria archaeon]
MDTLIADGYVLVEDGVVEADVGIVDGRVENVGEVDDADETVDASGCLVLPGLVNAHTHAPMTLLRGYADDLPLETWLRDRIWPAEAHLTDDDIRAGARLAALEMIRTGTTAFGDMYFGMEEVADVVEESGLRARLGYGIITEGKDEDEARDEFETGVEFAEEYDGTADGRVRTMLTPHAPYTCDDWLLESAAERASELGCPLHTHLSETEDEVDETLADTGERPTWYLDEIGFWEGDAYVAHAVHLEPDEVRHLSDKDVSVAHCPSANMKLASGAAPVAEMVDRGVNVAVGTDGVASNNNLDMFEEMRHAALLSKVTEGDAAALPARSALDAATRNGAYALGFNAGAVEPRRPADIAVVDLDAPHLSPEHDLVSHAVYSAKGSDVKATVVDGEVLMDDGEVRTLDEDRVIREAQEAARELVSRVEDDEG